MNTTKNSQQNTFLKWFKASRPHTMGLSFAVILAGSSQIGWQQLRLDVLILTLLSAAGLQLISNFANDYGDFVKGTDSHRQESYRALSAGNFTVSQIRSAIIYLSLFCLITISALVYVSPISILGKWVMLLLCYSAIIAALTYTLGRYSYGYFAMGDIMVFAFFGVLGVAGSYFLQGGDLDNINIWLLTITFGGLSTSVLNINNMRDREKDIQHKKITIANLLTKQQSMAYQYVLFISAIISLEQS